uniref:EGF_2 domain-containing protein n=1 Tax=Steinernema glaseri TaxID=37863 RepID=A0A1I8APX9_9BILA
LVCSNNGVCQCGKCICNDGFTGHTCGVEETAGELHLDEQDDDPSSEEEQDTMHEHEDGMNDDHPSNGIGALPAHTEEGTMTTEGAEDNATAEPAVASGASFAISSVLLVAIALLR